MAEIYETTLIAVILLSAMLCMLHLAYRPSRRDRADKSRRKRMAGMR